ncbi:MAG TPA: glycosyltransferase family A protein [Terriglobia bacterium]|nr:glycosyltransferase family A protein [Terriglobia bacterium]
MSGTNMFPKYAVITPVRDEEAYLRFTLECVIAQTIRPSEWVIVNDGSTDGTGAIIDEYARQHSWIHGVHRANRGHRKSGGGVIEAFNDGYATLSCSDWDFIVKLDGDLSFEPDYFEKCFEYFEREPGLGVGGGVIYHVLDGNAELELGPAFHVRGATKIYRRACWEGIGGFWPAPGWDTLDEVKANMLGWTTKSFPDLQLWHHRFTGSADGRWGGIVKNGKSDYISGYHPLFMLAKCISRLVHKPYVVGSLGLAYGFVTGYLKRIPQVNDPELIRYLRGEQLGRLWGRETIWR